MTKATQEISTSDTLLMQTIKEFFYVGGLPSEKVDTSGCKWLKKARTIQVFSTASKSKMYKDCPGWPYKVYVTNDNYLSFWSNA
mmetsp:Transcript_57540/g.85660  ORF Transcript_57540/g.85660 Transcript_57540/m.85660 type:complete len:84 (-) Transcript_57540:155-406(-)